MIEIAPLSVGQDASSFKYMNYVSGILVLSKKDCTEDNHAVVAVGYSNTDPNNKVVKTRNSYGTSWGEAGYVRIKQNDKVSKTCYNMANAFVAIVN